MFQKISGIENFYASECYVTIFRRKFFVSQCRKISWRNLSALCFRKNPVAKKFMEKKGGIKILCQNFLSHSAENFRRGESFSVSLISSIKKVWIRGGGGVSRFSVQNYLSHSAEKFRRGTLWCFTKFGYRKNL